VRKSLLSTSVKAARVIPVRKKGSGKVFHVVVSWGTRFTQRRPVNVDATRTQGERRGRTDQERPEGKVSDRAGPRIAVRKGVRLFTRLLRHPFDTCGQVPLLEPPLPRSAHRRVGL
jgi:hypothetical protein